MCRHLFAAMRAVAGRSRRIERDVADLLIITRRMEKTMSDLLAKLEALEAQVNAYTTDQGNKIATAVAAARKAQMAEDQESAKAELADALAKIDEIGKGLVTFTPSGN